MKLLLSLLVLITVFAVGLFTGRNTVTPRTVLTPPEIRYIQKDAPAEQRKVEVKEVFRYRIRKDTLNVCIATVKEVEKPVYITRDSPVSIRQQLLRPTQVIFSGFRPDSARWEQQVIQVPRRKVTVEALAAIALTPHSAAGIGIMARLGRARVGGVLFSDGHGVNKFGFIGIDLLR